jgi:hypothetical protein
VVHPEPGRQRRLPRRLLAPGSDTGSNTKPERRVRPADQQSAAPAMLFNGDGSLVCVSRRPQSLTLREYAYPTERIRFSHAESRASRCWRVD